MTSVTMPQAGGFLGFAQQLEALLFHALEIVGRSARLEGAAAQHARSRRGDTLRPSP